MGSPGLDDVSVVSRNKGGVHVILKQSFHPAVNVHCNSLTESGVSQHVSTCFDTVKNIHRVMRGSSRHAGLWKCRKSSIQDTELGTRSVDTCWSSKSGAVSQILMLLDVILEVFAECAIGQTKVEAQSLLQQLQTKQLRFLLVVS